MPTLQDIGALIARFKKYILYLGVYVLIVSVLAFPFTGMIIDHMKNDLLNKTGEKYQLVQTSPLELMMLELKMSVAIGIIAALPIAFFYAYRFLANRSIAGRFTIRGRDILIVSAIALFLFVAGCLYAYLLMLPMVYDYLLNSATQVGIENTWRVSDFINFSVMTTLTFGVVFELPLVMTALARAHMVSPAIFRKYRRHMWVIILIVAALVTSPDVLTQIMVGVPLIVFYELSLFSLRFTAPEYTKGTKDAAGRA